MQELNVSPGSLEITDLEKLLSILEPRVLSLVHEEQFGFSREGNSSSLGGEHDRELLVALRDRSEIIVTSGKTAELEKYKQPSKPLVLLTTRPDAASWLQADRFHLSDSRFRDMLANRKVLYETGLSISRELFGLCLIDQIMIHHDRIDFDSKVLDIPNLIKLQTTTYYGRYISIFGRGS